MCAAVDTL